MSQSWEIRIHRLVIEEDFKSIDAKDRAFILSQIRKKLSSSPKTYGKPLSGAFKHYWKLRAGDYRVIYRIIKEEILVLVIKVGARRDEKVYKELVFRLKKI